MSAATYEQPEILAQYLHFHYACAEDYLPWPGAPAEALDFPRRCAEVLLAELSGGKGARVAELGCAVGRAAFELSAVAESVDALDFSGAFIAAAQRLQAEGKLAYRFALEGGRVADFLARLPSVARPERVRFVQGDACAPPEDWSGFDGVLLANLLCRLPDPRACLRHLVRLVRPGGVALITTPCSWSADFTPPEAWLCQEGTTLEGIARTLEPQFRMRRSMDMPMLIREHARKYQWTVVQASVWEQRA